MNLAMFSNILKNYGGGEIKKLSPPATAAARVPGQPDRAGAGTGERTRAAPAGKAPDTRTRVYVHAFLLLKPYGVHSSRASP